jgi:hypothetical protein
LSHDTPPLGAGETSFAASLLIASNHPVDAQKKRPTGVASLAEMSCQSIKGKNYEATNQDIPVGLEVFRAVGLLHWMGLNGVTQVACRLAQPKEKPKYKTLTLAFGFHDGDQSIDGSTVRLSLYRDGQAYGYKDISKGEKLLWQVDVMGTRSLAIETECIRGGGSQNFCPTLFFFEDTLK